ncbi:MAG: hypothetical protein Tsb0013_19570 [Phycisphaerales bacterium]
MRTLEAHPLPLDVRCTLGEGPVWAHGELAFVDIEQGAVHLASLERVRTSRTFGARVGAVLPSRTGWIAAVEGCGLVLLDRDLRGDQILAHPDAHPYNRYNDGAVDPRGRLWIGTMNLDGRSPTGALYRVDPSGAHERVLDNLRISNGLAWSPDARTLYFTDTGNRRIDAYDYDPDSGAISNRRDLVHVTDGYPDGHCTDAQGGLWVAHWGGARVTRFDSDGVPTLHVGLACANATSCCFAGDDLATLVITTAGNDTPHAGAVFGVRTGHAGMESHSVRF